MEKYNNNGKRRYFRIDDKKELQMQHYPFDHLNGMYQMNT